MAVFGESGCERREYRLLPAFEVKADDQLHGADLPGLDAVDEVEGASPVAAPRRGGHGRVLHST